MNILWCSQLDGNFEAIVVDFRYNQVRFVCRNKCVYRKVTQDLLGNPTSPRSWGSLCPIISWMIGCTNGAFKGCPFARIHLRTSHISSRSCRCFSIIVKWFFSNKDVIPLLLVCQNLSLWTPCGVNHLAKDPQESLQALDNYQNNYS